MSMKIVSLLPSATEIVCALGAVEQLVGISHECDFPEEVKGKAVLTSSRIDPYGTSLSIDQAVRSVIKDVLSIYAIDEQRLAALSPDVIVTQDLCEVCAVSLDDVKSAVARISHRNDVKIVSLTPTRLGHLWSDIMQVAEGIERREAGRVLCLSLQARLAEIQQRSAMAPRLRVASVEWMEPIMLGGTWMPELIELAGGAPIGAAAGEMAPTIKPEELMRLNPEVVLVKPCGFTLERTIEERALIEGYPGVC
jgi:iron complex transport system substrate-binding protein